ncbi:MAG: TetR/AcrR family transcriptional regulator [Williamsia herbipolensis]|uniref:Transcriptional regulator, TetR family n=1 Tax=Williamsia serinedens TaxID=391736 RepID=A0ABT1H098_9NOCA|nr:TetR/AcrR family transcriptional regulator [Williamsia serinedens]MBE7160977.1 TetR/AcrR family transcriptional regulator [Williamsia herbipolensis]MCP2159948.1 transcriptional regulator, TetR family [Williamsia serinedens]
MVVRNTSARTRSDAIRSRSALTDAVGRLLEDGRVDFSVPELASEAGVGVATAYRHFPSPSDALHAYYSRAAGELVDALLRIDVDAPAPRFDAYCEQWVAQAQVWGPAVRHIRSHQGFIERLVAGDPAIVALHGALAAVVQELVDAQIVPASDVTATVLLWVTVFDERVVYDLAHHHGWSTAQIVDHLTSAVRGALRFRDPSTG